MMRRAVVIVTVMMGLLVWGLRPASAITYGEIDGSVHPEVGVLVFEYQSQMVFICSGTLIAPDVFLTAGHCTAALASMGVPPNDVWVSFDSDFDGSTSTLYPGTYHTNPAYYMHSFAAYSDLGVVVLDEPIVGITPASLPDVGMLNELGPRGLRGQRFTAVGYGSIEPTIGGGPPSFDDGGVRRAAVSRFDALNKNWLRLSSNAARGDGGTCYGDSGGPNFLGAGGSETHIIAGITITGDSLCLATNVVLRLDTEAAHSFLDPYLYY